MKYKLKNEKLWKVFCELDSYFSTAFNEECKRHLNDKDDVIRVCLYGNGFCVVTFLKTDIEGPNVYDPCGWNVYPDVTPPTEVDMRVELGEGCGFMAWFDGTNWRTENHSYTKSKIIKGVKRFRPWED